MASEETLTGGERFRAETRWYPKVDMIVGGCDMAVGVAEKDVELKIDTDSWTPEQREAAQQWIDEAQAKMRDVLYGVSASFVEKPDELSASPGFAFSTELSRLIDRARASARPRFYGFGSAPRPEADPPLERHRVDAYCKEHGLVLMTQAEVTKLERAAKRGGHPDAMSDEVYRRCMRF